MTGFYVISLWGIHVAGDSKLPWNAGLGEGLAATVD
jgi:hypothetical protein